MANKEEVERQEEIREEGEVAARDNTTRDKNR